MTTEEILQSLGVEKIDGFIGCIGGQLTPITYYKVEGKLQTYCINVDTYDVLDNHGHYISVVQPPHGHKLQELLAIVMALKNDDVMVKFIPTLQPRIHDVKRDLE